jgi:hypothetical protein
MRTLNPPRSVVIGVILVIAVLALTVLGTTKPLEAAGPPDGLETEELNVDVNGFIAVHEQGVADVNIVGGDSTVSIDDTDPIDVDVIGIPAVEISSMPSVVVSSMPTVDLDAQTDDVLADIKDLLEQALDQPPASITPIDQTHRHSFNLTATADPEKYEFPAILATQLLISTDDDEIDLIVRNGARVLFRTGSADNNFPVVFSIPFTHPVEMDSVEVECKNEVLTCSIDVSIFGFAVDG